VGSGNIPVSFLTRSASLYGIRDERNDLLQKLTPSLATKRSEEETGWLVKLREVFIEDCNLS